MTCLPQSKNHNLNTINIVQHETILAQLV